MKDGVRIINCARGGLIDEEALYEAVSDGKVAGCGLDVFEKEPPGNTPLLSLDGVIASPHLGASTAEAQKNVSLQMARQFKNALQDGIIDNSVNCPHVDSAVLARIGPYLDMSEKLGSFLCQVTGENIESAEITCTVDIAEYHARLFTLSFLKGLLSCTVPEYVNYVNSLVVARERGIRVTEKKSSHPDDFPGIIKAEITTAGSSRSISGTIFGKDDPRIVSIDGYRVDVSPKGCLLFCINSDKPGAVAHISSVLTGAGINIAGMTVGRKEAGGEALTVLNIDSRTSQEVLARIKENPVIRKAYLVEL
jgi:D-3-phosphoglycerate dehydrogenase